MQQPELSLLAQGGHTAGKADTGTGNSRNCSLCSFGCLNRLGRKRLLLLVLGGQKIPEKDKTDRSQQRNDHNCQKNHQNRIGAAGVLLLRKILFRIVKVFILLGKVGRVDGIKVKNLPALWLSSRRFPGRTAVLFLLDHLLVDGCKFVPKINTILRPTADRASGLCIRIYGSAYFANNLAHKAPPDWICKAFLSSD